MSGKTTKGASISHPSIFHPKEMHHKYYPVRTGRSNAPDRKHSVGWLVCCRL